MKKNKLVILALLFIGVLSFSACKNDESLSKTFKGRYSVRVTDINLKELEDASNQVKTELEKGKIELHGELEKAQKELGKEVNIEIDGKKANLKELIGEVGQGLEKVMDGLGDIGNGFGKGITDIIIKNTTFQVDFRDNGELAVGSDNQSFNFSSKKLTWEVKDGKLLIKDTEQKKDNLSFDLTTKNEKEWELTSDKMTLALTKIK